MRKGCVGQSIMDSSEGPVSIYMSGAPRRGPAFSNFTDTLQFPGSINALPQQPCESFPFDFSLICTEKGGKKKSISIYQPAGVVRVKAGWEFYVKGPHLNI